MKPVVAVIVLVAFLINCAPTLPQYEFHVYERKNAIMINKVVGGTIDSDEGKRFGLFTGIGEFREAQFYVIEDSGYVVEIVTEDETLAAINCDKEMVVILRDYVNRYEEISTDYATFESKWGILDYDTLGIPITENEVNLAMMQSRGRAMRNGCAGCGSSALFALLVGGAIAAGGANGGSDIGPALGVLAGAIVLGAIATVGLVVAGTSIAIAYSKNKADFVKNIKEARKPKPYGAGTDAGSH